MNTPMTIAACFALSLGACAPPGIDTPRALDDDGDARRIDDDGDARRIEVSRTPPGFVGDDVVLPDADEPAAEAPPREPPPPPTLDACDESEYADADWIVESRGSFRFYFFDGTAAQRDIETIAADREVAYREIRDVLGIEAAPVITVYLSPNRSAARAHHVGVGRAYPGWDQIDVLYTGAANGFESVRYGHELTHVLAHYITPAGYSQLPVLSEGMAEYLDSSGRDMHVAYVEQLDAGSETRTHVASFDWGDVGGDNYGRAGSLVQALVEAYGVEALVALSSATAVRWNRGCYRHDDFGCIDSPEAIGELLDGVLDETTGTTWADFQAFWRTTVEAVLATHTPQLRGDDHREIASLLRHADEAINASDPTAYRATMEGFYCDWLDEPGRERLARRVVGAFDTVHTEIAAIYPTAHKNFPTARAIVTRTEDRGVVSSFPVSLEHFPMGWRITWLADWQ